MAKEQTGISGEFWFFSQLQRLGYEAYITLGNTKGIDLSVKLNNGSILTLEVKSKMNFGGSFQYLNIAKEQNHFAVFVDLKTIKEKSGKTKLLGEPNCYIINSNDLDQIAFNWQSTSGAKGYGFEAKLLWYLKFQNTQSITNGNINAFIDRHNLNKRIDFKYYNKIIWTLEDFENYYYQFKEKLKPDK